MLAVGNDGQFRRLCKCLEIESHPEIGTFQTNVDRVKHRVAVDALLASAIKTRERDALLAALHAANVPAGAVYDMAEACAQPQAQELLLQGGGRKAFRSIALSGFEGQQLSPPPLLAADTKDILEGVLELDEAAIEELRLQKAIL